MSNPKSPDETIDELVKKACEELQVTPDELNKLFDSQSVPEFVENHDKLQKEKQEKKP